ncbi:hypothetical protein, partial [Escherichia coli]
MPVTGICEVFDMFSIYISYNLIV